MCARGRPHTVWSGRQAPLRHVPGRARLLGHDRGEGLRQVRGRLPQDRPARGGVRPRAPCRRHRARPPRLDHAPRPEHDSWRGHAQQALGRNPREDQQQPRHRCRVYRAPRPRGTRAPLQGDAGPPTRPPILYACRKRGAPGGQVDPHAHLPRGLGVEGQVERRLRVLDQQATPDALLFRRRRRRFLLDGVRGLCRVLQPRLVCPYG
mmetsp:Transcript_15023/g.46006  ORF Transcript_15023/g.46006 Transcript_15023/m.46006 type:complete len:207 (-) Transcript_15023:1416-2036(-)